MPIPGLISKIECDIKCLKQTRLIKKSKFKMHVFTELENVSDSIYISLPVHVKVIELC